MLINGRFLTQRTTGQQRFGRELLQAATGHSWAKDAAILMPHAGDDSGADFAGIPVKRIGRMNGHAWEQFELSRACSDDMLVNLCATAPVFLRNQIVVLHDAAVAAYPQSFTLAFRAWYHTMIRLYGRSAHTVGTVSEFSAGEIVKHFGIPAKKIEVIPESGEHILRAEPDYGIHEKHGLEKDGYFLAVSSMAPNKNFMGVLEAVARLPDLPFKFVIVGGNNAKVFNEKNINVSGAVRTGYVTDGQLRALYERAACFVYPSLYEGFGLPPLEAMACGCPVIVSDRHSLPEVCGDAALYCNPYDPADIAKQLGRMLGDAALREELRTAGIVHSAKWTWDSAARKLGEITNEMASKK